MKGQPRRYFFTKEMCLMLMDEGVEDKEIWTLLNVSEPTFYRWKKSPDKQMVFTKEMYLKFKRLGMNDIEIRSMFKTSKRTFLKWKKLHKLEVYRGEEYTFTFDEIKTLWHEGNSFGKIARMYGISVSGLCGWVKRQEEKGYKL